MRYFVIAPDGNRYGPADVSTLGQWVAEGRVLPTTMLEEEDTAVRIPATSVSGLMFPQANMYPNPMGLQQGYPGTGYEQPPTPNAMYPRGYGYDNGSSNLTGAFILFACGALFCVLAPVLCSFGPWQSNLAIQKGNPSGNIARILNLVLLILGCCVWLFYIIAIIVAVSAGGGNF